MSATIDISNPTPGSTVGRSFTSFGSSSYDPSAPSNTTIVVSLKDSSGNLISVTTGSNPVVINVTTGQTMWPWSAPFAVGADYSDCRVVAEVRFDGTLEASDAVEDIDITQ